MQNHLTEHQMNIFNGFASLLGKDTKDNIITLVTHSDRYCPWCSWHHCEVKDPEWHQSGPLHIQQSSVPKLEPHLWQHVWEDMEGWCETHGGVIWEVEQDAAQTQQSNYWGLKSCGKRRKVYSEVAATCCPVCEENCYVGFTVWPVNPIFAELC